MVAYMKKKAIIFCSIIFFTTVCCCLLAFIKYTLVPRTERYIDHIENKNSNPQIGLKEIADDRIVDETFTSHLPLIIIDTEGKEIANYKEYDKETDSFEIPYGVDPYFSMDISVIDSEKHINKLSDSAAVQEHGKIKVRGNSSAAAALPKLQYTVKLLDEGGMNKDVSLLGMGAENTWILNPTVRDISYIRNYLAYNIAGQLEPYQPDVRYCEVLFKNKDQYEYMGLYILYEAVEVSENRVNIKKDVSKYNLGQGYLLKKDRYDKNAVTLNTWGTDLGYYYVKSGGEIIGKSFFTLEYPSNENATQEVKDNITEELSQIEKLLYIDELRDFKMLEQRLDIDSFADFFIINEFFASYDAGLHSTFMYKSADGKLTIGPYWDFDGAMDNSRGSLTSEYFMVLPYRPWFNCLVKTEEFVKKVENRYRDLRKTILNEEYINTFIDDTLSYLGNAVLRDRSVYADYYYDLMVKDEEITDLSIDRRRYTVEDEVLRVKDFIHVHGKYMDSNISSINKFVENTEKTTVYNTLAGAAFLMAFIIAVVLVQRYRNEA